MRRLPFERTGRAICSRVIMVKKKIAGHIWVKVVPAKYLPQLDILPIFRCRTMKQYTEKYQQFSGEMMCDLVCPKTVRFILHFMTFEVKAS